MKQMDFPMKMEKRRKKEIPTAIVKGFVKKKG